MDLIGNPTQFQTSYSFSMCALATLELWNEQNEPNHAIKIVKLITTEIALILLIPIAIIETIVQAIISLLVKTVHFFICDEKTFYSFAKNIYVPTVLGTFFSFNAIPISAMLLVANLKEKGSCDHNIKKVMDYTRKQFLEYGKSIIVARVDTMCKADENHYEVFKREIFA